MIVDTSDSKKATNNHIEVIFQKGFSLLTYAFIAAIASNIGLRLLTKCGCEVSGNIITLSVEIKMILLNWMILVGIPYGLYFYCRNKFRKPCASK